MVLYFFHFPYIFIKRYRICTPMHMRYFVLAAFSLTTDYGCTIIEYNGLKTNITFFSEAYMKAYILTFLISMVPLVELRAGIPAGVAMGLDWRVAVALCTIGNMVPVPIIFFFARRVLEWGADKPVIGKFFTWCLKKGHHGGEKLKAKAGKGMFWALLLFVGIPLPGTGAWTGTLAASLLDLDFKKSIVAITCGVLLAAVIITVATLLGFAAFVAVS